MRKLLTLPCMVLWAIAVFANNISEDDRQYFIDNYAEMAVEEMRINRIPASITLAQAILESSWGLGPVAQEANNFFCIKCYNGWTGPTFDAKDDEPGLSCFRKYENIAASFKDHSAFLTENVRYEKLFQYDVTDYESWAHGLKSCGYATDGTYGDKLINLIETYGLWMYDYAVSVNEFRVLNTPVLIDTAEPAEEEIAGTPTMEELEEPVAAEQGQQYGLTVPSWHINKQETSGVRELLSDNQHPSMSNIRNRKIRPIVPVLEHVPERR